MAAEITGYGMLRGWDEGYDIPSLGIIIHPDQRGKGLGKAFMGFLHRLAEKCHAQKIMLKTYTENEKALGLYKKMGYQFSQKSQGQWIGYFSIGESR